MGSTLLNVLSLSLLCLEQQSGAEEMSLGPYKLTGIKCRKQNNSKYQSKFIKQSIEKYVVDIY